ncbi:hypothetical protein OG21DRAFT_1487712 [Imleria badia]|nr:hypothetical protein OG21DRAFT_1487712 [Imleria badia]
MSAIIKKEELPLVIPLFFEETGDAKKKDCQSPSLSSYTLPPPSNYNSSTPIWNLLLLPEPVEDDIISQELVRLF